jgi:tetratricopeptide (TPR) repeat protein
MIISDNLVNMKELNGLKFKSLIYQKKISNGLVTQVKIKMKSRYRYLLVIIILGLLFQACNKRIVPSSITQNKREIYDSTTFDYVFTEALKQKFLGNAGDALKYLEQCIKINPKSDASYYEMAQISIMLSDNERGKKYALKALSLSNKNIWYLTLVANMYYQDKKVDSSIYYYEKAVTYYPEKEDLKMNLAKIYSENKEYKKAAEVYSYLENKYGFNETTSLSMIKNLINSGDYKSAVTKVKELLDKSPDEVLYNGLLAEIYQSTGENDKAKAIYKKLLEDNPGNPQIVLSLCDFMLNEKQFDDILPVLNTIAIKDSIGQQDKLAIFSKVVSDSSLVMAHGNEIEITLKILEADNKDNRILQLLRPELYVNENKLSEAITRLEEIIVGQPDNYFAWEKVLILYSETKNWDKLLSKGEVCATQFNTVYLPKILYASAALEKQKYEIAEEELRKAQILAGDNKDKLLQVLVMKADVLYRKKEYLKSFETFKEALKLSPEDVLILNNYAYYLAEQGQDLKEAERMSKQVIDKEKNNATYLDTYAWVLYKRGRYKEAEEIMEAIIKKSDKSDAEYYEHLGYIQKAMKKNIKAIESWKIAYKIDNRKSDLLKEIENCGKH